MTNWELTGIRDLKFDGDPMAVTLVAKGSRDRDPRVLEVRQGTGMGGGVPEEPKLGLHFQTPVGTSAASRALTEEALPASLSPSQLAVRAEFTVSAVLYVCPR